MSMNNEVGFYFMIVVNTNGEIIDLFPAYADEQTIKKGLKVLEKFKSFIAKKTNNSEKETINEKN